MIFRGAIYLVDRGAISLSFSIHTLSVNCDTHTHRCFATLQ